MDGALSPMWSGRRVGRYRRSARSCVRVRLSGRRRPLRRGDRPYVPGGRSAGPPKPAPARAELASRGRDYPAPPRPSAGLEHEEPRPEIAQPRGLEAVDVEPEAGRHQLRAGPLAGVGPRDGVVAARPRRTRGRSPRGRGRAAAAGAVRATAGRRTWYEPTSAVRRSRRHGHPGHLVAVAVERALEPEEAAALEQVAVPRRRRRPARRPRPARRRSRRVGSSS